MRLLDLRTAVERHSRVEGNLLLVDEFLNHRVDPGVLADIGASFSACFGPSAPDAIITAEASGIPPAIATGLALRVPVVYAKKFLGPGDRYAYFREVVSPTKGAEYRVEVARRLLQAGQRMIVLDDFLSGGRTAEALGDIIEEAGSTVAGMGFVIEKTYMEGRSRLENHGWEVHSLVKVHSLDDGVMRLG